MLLIVLQEAHPAAIKFNKKRKKKKTVNAECRRKSGKKHGELSKNLIIAKEWRTGTWARSECTNRNEIPFGAAEGDRQILTKTASGLTKEARGHRRRRQTVEKERGFGGPKNDLCAWLSSFVHIIPIMKCSRPLGNIALKLDHAKERKLSKGNNS